MKCAIYNPYLDTLGGGERYTVSFAKVMADLGYRVDIEWPDSTILKSLEKRFGLDLSKINVVTNIKKGDGYDLCFWVSDGSIPLLRARRNLLHFQIPFQNVNGKSLFNRMKLFRINKVICNSQFTKRFIDHEFGLNSLVLYPPVNVEEIKKGKKVNQILAVNRFSQLTQVKHQDILIQVFKKLVKKLKGDWRLVLAGGTAVGVGDYLSKLKNAAKGLPVTFVENPDFKELVKLYAGAKIFWSASGYGQDEVKNPEKVEHFGITLVEAMSAGAVPIAYNAGGHKEIISNEHNGFFFSSQSELGDKTMVLINNHDLLEYMAKKGEEDASKYSFAKFHQNVESIIR